jgi:hypothetical protein
MLEWNDDDDDDDDDEISIPCMFHETFSEAVEAQIMVFGIVTPCCLEAAQCFEECDVFL